MRLAAAGLAAALILPPSATAASPHLSFSLDAAWFLPTQESLRLAYASTKIPLTLRLHFHFDRGFGLYAGCRWLQAGGETVAVAPQFTDPAYPTRLQVATAQAGIIYAIDHKRLSLHLGCGLGYTAYREKWLDASFSASGKSLGLSADAALLIPLWKKISARVRCGLLYLPTEKSESSADEVLLGGFETALGLHWRF
jgi:hypothetical protein